MIEPVREPPIPTPKRRPHLVRDDGLVVSWPTEQLGVQPSITSDAGVGPSLLAVAPSHLLPDRATYRPWVNWGTGTAIDTTPYNDLRRWYLNDPGLVVDGIGRDQIRSYSPPAAPSFDLLLTNATGRFSPGGPIGTLLGRGSDAWLYVSWGLDAPCNSGSVAANDRGILANGLLQTSLFTGTTNETPVSLSRDSRTVGVRCLGRLAGLGERSPLTALYRSVVGAPFTVDQAITVVLDSIGWPASLRAIDASGTQLSSWWMDGRTKAIDALNTLLATEGAGACIYESDDGVVHYESRSHRQLAPRSLGVQWAVYDGPTGAATPGSSLQVLANDRTTPANSGTALANGAKRTLMHVIPAETQSNPDEVVDKVRCTVNVRTPTPTQTVGTERGKVWEYGGPLSLAANEVRVVYPTANDPFYNAVLPVPGTDYAIGAGGLAAVNPLVLLRPDGQPVGAEGSSGQTVGLQITAGNGGATINGQTSNGIQLRAVSLPVTSEVPIASTIDTSLTAPRYQPATYNVPLWPEIGVADAQTVANGIATRYSRERRQVTFRIANLDGEHMYMILNAQISDRVHFVHTHGGIGEPYWIEQIHHEIAPGGGLHVMTLGCERVYDTAGSRYSIATTPPAEQALYDAARYGE